MKVKRILNKNRLEVLTVRLPKSLINKIKSIAIKNGTTIRELLQPIIDKELSDHVELVYGTSKRKKE